METMKTDNKIGVDDGTMNVLSVSKLKELQREYYANKEEMTILNKLRKFYNNDFYTDFEKKIISEKANDFATIVKYFKVETFPITIMNKVKNITLSVIENERNLLGGNMGNDNVKPVMLFVHGLGGQLSQFEPFLKKFEDEYDFFGVELPGFGNCKNPTRNRASVNLKYMSFFQMSKEEEILIEKSLNSMHYSDFETDNLVEMIKQVLDMKFPERRFVIISHSMGSHISIKLVNKYADGKFEKMVILSPPSVNVSGENNKNEKIIDKLPFSKKYFLKMCYYLPRIFDYYRYYDREGELYSKSVENYIYVEGNFSDAENSDDTEILKRLTQFRWNLDSESIIFLTYLYGFKPVNDEELIKCANKLRDRKLLVCCGVEDKVTSVKESEKITDIVKRNCKDTEVEFRRIPKCNHSIFLDQPETVADIIYAFVEEQQ